ncbi:hypothetical protein [Micromonospora sp. WMMD736]|uniref:hypothetical protein n=1 Tax=Micromonospora sp. WMMD736 TaxID=3404112 RepID=UPI003B94AFEC
MRAIVAPRGDGLAALGADEVVVGMESVDASVDVVLDTVGGAHLVAAWGLLAPGGCCTALAGPPVIRPSFR